jgi:hypothetical protein
MLRTAEKIAPGISERVVFSNLGTPLTNEHCVRATGGSFYGTEKSRWQIGPFGYGVKSEIADLYLCGASTIGHGVAGATASGLFAASAMLGCRVSELLGDRGRTLPTYPCDDISEWPASLRRKVERKRAGAPRAVAAAR